MKTLVKDKLCVRIFDTRDAMGKAAAEDISDCIRKLLAVRNEINMIFAAAPSQNEVLKYLTLDKSIDWGKVNAFHMDEYVGLAKDAPQCFSNFLKTAIFDRVPFRSVNLIDCTAPAAAECERYSALLKQYPVDIVVMGIGENGHIAFNDPHVADFNDKALVKKVNLDDTCRMQQVHDGCFEKFEDVPEFALTLTVTALMNAAHCFCVVPAKTKAVAISNTLNGEIGEHCPATVLRLKDNAVMYCDTDSAVYI